MMYCKIVFDIALDREFDYIIPAALSERAAPGLRVKAPFGPRAATGIITRLNQTPDGNFKLKEISEIYDGAPAYGMDFLELGTFIQDTWGGPLGRILFSLLPFFTGKNIEDESLFPAAPPPLLTPAQKHAEEEILNAKEPLLLYGPAGSGKETAVISAALKTAESGQVLILLPDIFSCEKFAARLQKYYPRKILIWHSKVPQGAKKQIFKTLSAGGGRVTVGTRSACLLPFKNPTLFVCVNEENADYKQEENRPFYHARDILFHRAKTFNRPLAFVSAAPSLELLKSGIKEISLPPAPSVINPYPAVAVTGKEKGKISTLPDVTYREIEAAANNKETVLLIANSKGGAPLYACLNCGYTARCAACGGLLKFDESGNLACLKCNAPAEAEQKCPKCANVIFRAKAAGAQKVYTEIKKLFPAANVIRFEKEPPLLPKENANIIIAVRAAVKALDYADLIVFLDADMELNSPDFRAAERLAQTLFEAKALLFNARGGRMLITSDKADSALVNAVIHGDYKEFAREELEFRETFNFPPCAGLIKITAPAKDAMELKNSLQPLGQILGPIPCGRKTDKIKKQYLLLKNISLAAVNAALPKTGPKNKPKITVDPYSFF